MRIQRPQLRTILIVHEGYAEACLIRHLRDLYVPRNAGVSVGASNARGRGGKHVLDYALRLRSRHAYDEYAVLIDTDQDWNDAQRQRARTNGIHALESTPCLEAWLLAVTGHRAAGDTRQIKDAFERIYGSDAHDQALYARHFPRQVLDNARSRVQVLDQILRIFGA